MQKRIIAVTQIIHSTTKNVNFKVFEYNFGIFWIIDEKAYNINLDILRHMIKDFSVPIVVPVSIVIPPCSNTSAGKFVLFPAIASFDQT